MMRTLAALAAIVTLAACGSVTQLRPKQGMKEVPKAANAQKPQTSAELLAPSTQAQPERQADLISRSVERKEDPFDLPPGPDNGRNGQ